MAARRDATQLTFVSRVLERADGLTYDPVSGPVWRDAPVAYGVRRTGRTTALVQAAVALAVRRRCNVALLTPTRAGVTALRRAATEMAAAEGENAEGGVLRFRPSGSQICYYRTLSEDTPHALTQLEMPVYVLLDDIDQLSWLWTVLAEPVRRGVVIVGAAEATPAVVLRGRLTLTSWREHWRDSPVTADLSGVAFAYADDDDKGVSEA